MKRLYEFKCIPCGEIHEEYTEYKKVSTCPNCGGDTDKIISAPRISLEGITGDFPGAAAAWEKKHREQLNKETKKAQA
jgi:putative FmdB family regulatory protein